MNLEEDSSLMTEESQKMTTLDNENNNGKIVLGDHSNSPLLPEREMYRCYQINHTSYYCITSLFLLPNYSYKLNCTTTAKQLEFCNWHDCRALWEGS